MIPDRINQTSFTEDWNKGYGIRTLAAKYRVSQTTVRNVSAELNLPKRDTETRPHPPEVVARIADLWNDGKSATEVAEAMGGKWTRNMIISLVHRKGLSRPERAAASAKASAIRRPKPVKRPKAEKPIMDRAIKPPKPTTPKAAKGLVTGVAFPPLSPEELDQKRAAFAAEGKRTIKGMDAVANDNDVLLMERKFGQCAWPVGTPDRPRNQLVCGQPVFEGVEKCSYCLTHANRAFARDVSQPKPKDNLARAVRSWAA